MVKYLQLIIWFGVVSCLEYNLIQQMKALKDIVDTVTYINMLNEEKVHTIINMHL